MIEFTHITPRRRRQAQVDVIEEWVTRSAHPCPRCNALHGNRYVKGEGPQPVTDTHPNCRCVRVVVSGRFGRKI